MMAEPLEGAHHSHVDVVVADEAQLPGGPDRRVDVVVSEVGEGLEHLVYAATCIEVLRDRVHGDPRAGEHELAA